MIELKTCPFCGITPELVSGDKHGRFAVMCSNIQCESAYTHWRGSRDCVVSEWNTRADGWISVDDELPEYGEPVILSINNVVQRVTYMRDGSNDSSDWFEPYHYEDKGSGVFIDSDKELDWMELPVRK